MFHRIKEVNPEQDMTLTVKFVTGEKKQYDVKPLLSKYKQFGVLNSLPGLFNCVQVDKGGYGIVWNDELDLSCDELWYGGTPA